MDIIEFAKLPIEEQSKIIKDAGCLDCTHENINYAPKMGFEDKCTYATTTKWANQLVIKNSNAYLSYILDENGNWIHKVDEIPWSIGSLKPYLQHSYCNRHYDDTITNARKMYNKLIAEGKSIFDYYKWESQLYRDLKEIALDLAPDHENYAKLYASFSKSLYHQEPFDDENVGAIRMMDVVKAKYTFDRQFPETDVDMLFIMMLYYIVTIKLQENPDDAFLQKTMRILTGDAICEPELCDDVEFVIYSSMVKDYKESLPRWPYSDYLREVNKKYTEGKKKLREELMEEYNVTEDVFREYFDDNSEDSLISVVGEC